MTRPLLGPAPLNCSTDLSTCLSLLHLTTALPSAVSFLGLGAVHSSLLLCLYPFTFHLLLSHNPLQQGQKGPLTQGTFLLPSVDTILTLPLPFTPPTASIFLFAVAILDVFTF
jgi:hypothetical protein